MVPGHATSIWWLAQGSGGVRTAQRLRGAGAAARHRERQAAGVLAVMAGHALRGGLMRVA